MARTAPKKRTPAKPAAKPSASTVKPAVVENSDGTGQPIELAHTTGNTLQHTHSDAIQKAAGTTDAVNNPAIASRRTDTSDLEYSEERSVELVNRGGKIEHKDQSSIEIEPVHGNADLAARLAFLEEYVTIIISEGTDKQSEKYVYLAVNGEGAGPNGLEYVPRGVDVRIKRKFVSVLANGKHVRYKSVSYTEAAGALGERQDPYSNYQNPFQVVEDSAKGHAWLKQMRLSRR